MKVRKFNRVGLSIKKGKYHLVVQIMQYRNGNYVPIWVSTVNHDMPFDTRTEAIRYYKEHKDEINPII